VRDLPPWAYVLAAWVFWSVAALVVLGGMLLIGAMGLAAAG
jgi:hypothetical protein